MKLRIVMADPAGNRTAIVRSPVPAGLRAQTAARIMQIEDLRAEQVGFEVPPHMGGAGRLEMMGGEFCGNAARSYGFLLCGERERGSARLLIEISGMTGLLQVDCEKTGPGTGSSFARMPMPDRLDYSEEGVPLVISEGITHMILEEMDPDPAVIRKYVDRYGGAFDAFGMMFLQEDRLIPVVYVGAAGTLVYESSCGSGSLAAAWYLAQKLAAVPRGNAAGLVRQGDSASLVRQGDSVFLNRNHQGDAACMARQGDAGKPDADYWPGCAGQRDASPCTCRYTFQEPGGSITVCLEPDASGILQGAMGGAVQIEEERILSL